MKETKDIRSGMTLLEVLVAISLLGLVLGGGFKVIVSALEGFSEQRDACAATREGFDAVQSIVNDLRFIYLGQDEGLSRFEGKDGEISLQDGIRGRGPRTSKTDVGEGQSLCDDSLSFGVYDSNFDGPGIIEYRLVRNERGGIKGISRKYISSGGTEQEVFEKLLSTRVVSLQIRYLSRDDRWVEQWDVEHRYPTAVSIRVGLQLSPAEKPSEIIYYDSAVWLPAGREVEL